MTDFNKTHTFSAHSLPGGFDQEIRLDGVNIANAVVGYTIKADAGEIPTIELELGIYEVGSDINSRLIMRNVTRELLIRLGWTPPLEG